MALKRQAEHKVTSCSPFKLIFRFIFTPCIYLLTYIFFFVHAS